MSASQYLPQLNLNDKLKTIKSNCFLCKKVKWVSERNVDVRFQFRDTWEDAFCAQSTTIAFLARFSYTTVVGACAICVVEVSNSTNKHTQHTHHYHQAHNSSKPFNHIIIIFINRTNEIFVCVYNLIRLHSLSHAFHKIRMWFCGCWIDSRFEFHYSCRQTNAFQNRSAKSKSKKYNFVPSARLSVATDMCAFGVNFEPFILALSSHSNSKCDLCVVRCGRKGRKSGSETDKTRTVLNCFRQ